MYVATVLDLHSSSGLGYLPHEKRLQHLRLFSLESWHLKGNIIDGPILLVQAIVGVPLPLALIAIKEWAPVVKIVQ